MTLLWMESAMPKLLVTLPVSIFVVFAGVSFNANAADISDDGSTRDASASPYCQVLERCGPDGCRSYRVCARPCPDGFSCYPLYGAYGPYGGVGYWGAYTDSGWTHRR